MLDRSEAGKRGYLNEPCRLFHLRDGRVAYHIEGKSYPLQPMDVLLVSRNLIHLPVVEPGPSSSAATITSELKVRK